MTRKLAAVLILLGLFLPYSCDMSPVSAAVGVSWDSEALGGIAIWATVLLLTLYSLTALIGGVRTALSRRANGAHRFLVSVFLIALGVYLWGSITDDGGSTSDLVALVIGTVAAIGFFLWARTRGVAATRLPALMLAVATPMVVMAFLAFMLDDGLEYGAWVLTTGFVLGMVSEIRSLRGSTGTVE